MAGRKSKARGSPPADWRGSNLKERAEVVHYLLRHGGAVAADDGLVAGRMRDELGKGRAFGQLLKSMEDDGMIERDIDGRRTFRIALVDDWGLSATAAPVPPTQHRSVPELADEAPALDGSVDYDRLARHLLTAVVKSATVNPSDVRATAARLRKLEHDLERKDAELRATKERLREAKEQSTELRSQVDALTRLVKESEAERNRRTHRSESLTAPVREALDEGTRKELDALMRTAPAARG